MRLEQLTLSEIFKVGLPKEDPAGNILALAYLKNLKTDGTFLVGCPTETVTKMAECMPFSLGLADYYLTTTTIKTLAGATKYTYTFEGRVKVINHIKVAWIQDDVKTLFLDSSGVTVANPSGHDIPICNAMCVMNGQIIGAGVRSSKVPGHEGLDQSYIVWSAIGEDNFELTKANDAGSGNPNIGILWDIAPLQDSAIVFGSRGAAQLYYAEHLFGLRDIDIPLIKSRGLCASSTNIALYISNKNELIQVDKNGTFKNLGFAWIGKDVVSLRYLNGRNTFVLTTNTVSYILDEHGMFSYGYKVWGEFNSSLAVESAFEQSTYKFRTAFFNYSLVGLKFLEEISLRDALSGTDRTVKMYSESLSITQGTKILNSLHATKYPLVADSFSFEYEATKSPTLSDLKVQYRLEDRRFGNADYSQRAR